MREKVRLSKKLDMQQPRPWDRGPQNLTTQMPLPFILVLLYSYPIPHRRLVCWQERGSRSFSKTCLFFEGNSDRAHANSFLKPKAIYRTFLLLRPLPYHLPSTWRWKSHWSDWYAMETDEMTLCFLETHDTYSAMKKFIRLNSRFASSALLK